MWPDFTADDLRDAIEEYASRKRRFGGLAKATYRTPGRVREIGS